MEYIYCFPFISLSQPETISPIAVSTTPSTQSTTPSSDRQPSLNTSEILVRFS